MKNFLEKKFRRKGQQAENDKTERVTGLGRRTREEIAKWNQMTALRFQTVGRHQTSPASLPGEEKQKVDTLHVVESEECIAFSLFKNNFLIHYKKRIDHAQSHTFLV